MRGNKQIGAVGAKLYYPDKSIQHAGIAYGIAGIAGNLLVRFALWNTSLF